MIQAEAYFLATPGQPLVKKSLRLNAPAADEALVEVTACGLCHTDLGFANGSVPTRHPLPLILGHEVTGKVVAAGEAYAHLQDQPVIVPAVLPCGHCPWCQAERTNACPNQKMPGNDIHGGFATHLLVPAPALVSLADAPPGSDLAQLAVVADAVSTAYQAIQRSGLQQGDAAFVVGIGGVGGFVAQIAYALGAKVVALDIKEERLELMRSFGADETLLLAGETPKEICRYAHRLAKEWGIPSLRYRIFECAGVPESQILAFGLLGRAATLVQVGYTPEPVNVRLSNLMAFDATIHGTWGCPPHLYQNVLELIYTRQVVLEPFVKPAPMSAVNDLLEAMAHHRLEYRMVMDPRL